MPAFGQSNRLIPTAFDLSLASLVHLSKGAAEETELALWLLSKALEVSAKRSTSMQWRRSSDDSTAAQVPAIELTSAGYCDGRTRELE